MKLRSALSKPYVHHMVQLGFGGFPTPGHRTAHGGQRALQLDPWLSSGERRERFWLAMAIHIFPRKKGEPWGVFPCLRFVYIYRDTYLYPIDMCMI